MTTSEGGPTMSEQLTGKVALVTGAASGIGRAAALAFVREDARVIVADVDEAGGQETVRRIQAGKGEAHFIRADVTQAADVESLVRRTVELYGRLDCAFNNAGTESQAGGARIHAYPQEDWDRVIEVNLRGVWLCMKFELAQMLEQGGGAIVNTSSMYGLVGGRSPAYTASKHGVLGLTRCAALQYAKDGIRVNAICPGFTRTPMMERALAREPEREAAFMQLEPVGRLGTAEEVAEAAIWLCSDAASFVTGHGLSVDGGYVAQ
jgi:NAD(P)-dependent dehydrogenase (short-subunit alcohol dehydrogenase family)